MRMSRKGLLSGSAVGISCSVCPRCPAEPDSVYSA